MVEATLKVTGMHCPKCDARVEKAVSAVAGVASVKADHEADLVTLTYDGSRPRSMPCARSSPSRISRSKTKRAWLRLAAAFHVGGSAGLKRLA